MNIANITKRLQEKVDTCEKNYIQCAERNDFDNAEKWGILEKAYKDALKIIEEEKANYCGVNF